MRIEVRGIRELQARIAPGRLIHLPFRVFLTKALYTIEAAAKPLIPRDTGYLGRSLQSEIRGNVGTVGTKAPHALYVHGRPPNPPARSRPHFPPIAQIAPWARRHGVNPYVVARAIARKGTRLVPFLTMAAKQSQPAIRALTKGLARDIERKAG